MASVERKILGPRASLETRLAIIDIRVPDQQLIHHKMRIARLGLHPDTEHVPFRRWLRWPFASRFKNFEFDEFLKDWHRNYGGYPPREIIERANRIRRSIPEAWILVRANYDDPALVVRLDFQEVIVGMWWRDPNRAKPWRDRPVQLIF